MILIIWLSNKKCYHCTYFDIGLHPQRRPVFHKNNHTMTIALSCPTSLPGENTVVSGHGSGGLLTHQLLDNYILNELSNDLLDQQHDGAVFKLDGALAFSTDSYVVSPIFFPGGNIGDLAVNGTVNDLAMCGAKPRFLSLSFILEEGFSLQEFKQIIASIKQAAIKADVQIVTGDTKVVEKGKGDKIFINTSGIGVVHPNAAINYGNIKPGDKIIINGSIARHGMAIMSVREGLEFETTLQSDSTNLNHTIYSLLDEFGGDVHFLRDPTRGGVASSLNEIAGKAKTGIQLYQSLLPIDAQTEGACELLGLDPLYVANEGLFIAIVAADSAEAIVKHLRNFDTSANAAVIGEVIDSYPGKVLLKNTIGGQRVVNLLPGEQLPRIC